METRVLPFDDRAIAEAARLILEEQPVAVPTETVYGLAADATSADAVARIYQAKGRPSFNPLIVHVPDQQAAELIGEFSAEARALAERHWPGPLTLVVPLRSQTSIASLVTAGLPTIALRVPAHPAMQALLSAVGKPLAAPSANASGSISPTRAEHVLKSLSGRIPLVIDAGPTERGLESTIVAATGGTLRLLRPGPMQVNALASEADEFLIGFSEIAGDASLSPSGDLREAAARLFDLLHHADASTKPAIAVAAVPDTGLGRAINDRLRRAAHRS
jgi:L-threonylcarbamoyladenylate synthase